MNTDRKARSLLDSFESLSQDWGDGPVLGEPRSMRLRVPAVNAQQMAADMGLLDRELRRAALYIASGRRETDLHLSDPHQLKVAATGESSWWLDVVLDVGNQVPNVLLSQPVQLLAITDWLYQRSRPVLRPALGGGPPASERVDFNRLPDGLDELVRDNPDRDFSVEISTDGVVITIGRRRRWFRSVR